MSRETTNCGLTDIIMDQAQTFASAWSLVGGIFDNGEALEDSQEAKAVLCGTVEQALAAKHAEIAALTAERDALQAEVTLKSEYARTTSNAHEAACEERDALKVDAERYRWLDANGLFAQPQGYDTQIGIAAPDDPKGILFVSEINTHIASNAIDAAMAQAAQPHQKENHA